MLDLENIELIKQLKARYFRALDSKLWPLMAECLTEDCVAKYDGGKYSFNGREQIVSFFSQYMGNPQLIFMHQGHHPEITIESTTSATGIWYLQDTVINLDNQTTLRGAGFYHDRYSKINGQWQIQETGYERTFEETQPRGDTTLNFNRFQA